MTTDEKLDLLVSEVTELKQLIPRFDNLENKVEAMQEDIDVLKRTAVWAETDLQRKVNVLLENHSDLSKNVNVAKDIEERVGVVEFDVKVIKALLNRTQPKISFSS